MTKKPAKPSPAKRPPVPAAGGSWVRQPDGSLVKAEDAGAAPGSEAAKSAPKDKPGAVKES